VNQIGALWYPGWKAALGFAWAMRQKPQQDGLGFAIQVDEQL